MQALEILKDLELVFVFVLVFVSFAKVETESLSGCGTSNVTEGLWRDGFRSFSCNGRARTAAVRAVVQAVSGNVAEEASSTSISAMSGTQE